MASSTKKMVNPCLPNPQYFLYRIQGLRNRTCCNYLNNYVIAVIATVGTNSLSVFPFSHLFSLIGEVEKNHFTS